MSFLTNLREFFKRDPDDPRVQGGVGGEEFDLIQQQTESAADARREAERRQELAQLARETTTSPLPESAATDFLVFDDLTPEEQDIAQQLVTSGQADNLTDAISKFPEQFPGLTEREASEQSPDVKVSPEDPDPADKGAIENVEDTFVVSNPEASSSTETRQTQSLRQRNPLSVFSSYSSIISLFVLTKEELANPDAYRQSEPEFLIARTGGLGADSNNIAPTIFEENLGIRVEYFLDDLEVESLLAQTAATRQTNATLIRFTLKEPYSMGMFLKALQFTVQRADPERKSYIDPPYLLKIDFKGFDDQGRYVTIPRTSRYIPIKLNRIEFNVSAGGSEYQIEAIAWNDQAYADEIQTIVEDLSLSGRNVREFLTTGLQGRRLDTEKQGLAGFLEKRELDLTKPNDDDQEPFKEKPDKFIISFPDSNSNRQPSAATSDDQGAIETANDSGITVNSGGSEEAIINNLESFNNKIGKSEIVVNNDSAGTFTDGERTEDGDLQLQRVTVSRDGRLLQFPAGMRIQDIIEEVVLLSEYAKDLAEKEPDSLGYKDWFRIETRVYEQSGGSDKITGKTPKVYVYSIVPYKVESHRFLGPEDSLGDRSIDELKRLAPKKYEYIYSGANDDIISFDLQFNTAFFQGLQQDLGQYSQRIQEGARSFFSLVSDQTTSENNPDFAGVDIDLSQSDLTNNFAFNDFGENSNSGSPRATVQKEPSLNVNTGQRGGSAGTGDTDERTAIARNFNEIIVNGIDLITLDIEIWGDPFYIADSGLGNYNAAGTGNPYVTSDNTLDYQYFEPICLLEFRTPIDYNQDGQMDFPENQSEPVAEFSGVYRIITVRNRISSNRFTQELQMIRLRNQELQERSENVTPSFTIRNLPSLSGFSLGQSNNIA